MKRRFTKLEIKQISGASMGSINDYVKLLDKAGYIRITGKDRWANCYLLAKDVGPKRPEIPETKKEVAL